MYIAVMCLTVCVCVCVCACACACACVCVCETIVDVLYMMYHLKNQVLCEYCTVVSKLKHC